MKNIKIDNKISHIKELLLKTRNCEYSEEYEDYRVSLSDVISVLKELL